MKDSLKKASIEYHELPTPGKISISPTKALINQRDLSLAYSPGVAFACKEIAEDERNAAKLTSRANLVGVVTNGTAVLGLGDIGPLAGKPVMEGKACLFKKFAGIDVFDIELKEKDPDKLVEIISSLEPTLGGINLEDIKAPECFYIEKKLTEKMNIPVFHDDQHGTAIIVTAAIMNGCKVVDKKIQDVKLVCLGAGAAAIACLDLLVKIGLKKENIIVCDSKGVIYEDRGDEMPETKKKYAQKTNVRSLSEALVNADIFLGLSGPGLVKEEWIKSMANKPLVLALANPIPEILPEEVKKVKPDAIIATGRSDYPNQVNNVLCFPFIFRGALDVGATVINEEMKIAAVNAIAELAQAETSEIVSNAYGDADLSFGPEYIIPTPFDPRLIIKIAPAVAKAAIESGVATLPINDFNMYVDKLTSFVYQSGFVMKPIFSAAKKSPKRVIFADGEDVRVLRAIQVIIDEKIAEPILIGRPDVVEMRIKKAGLKIIPGKNFELVNPESDERYKDVWQEYYQIMQRKGVSIDEAKFQVRQSTTLIGAMLLKRGDGDSLICGTFGKFNDHLVHIKNVIGLKSNATILAAMNVLMLPKRTLFIVDTYVNENPSADQIGEITLMAAEEIKRFGIIPKVALLSHSNFGSDKSDSSNKMSDALKIIKKIDSSLEIDGEMQGDSALSENIRNRYISESFMTGEANLLVMPNIDAANISFNLLKMVAGSGITIGPILLGSAAPVQIVTPTASSRRLINMTALSVVDASSDQSKLI